MKTQIRAGILALGGMLVLTAIAFAAFGPPVPSAFAQQDTVPYAPADTKYLQVNNINESFANTWRTGDDEGLRIRSATQPFTTGSFSGSYVIRHIDVRMRATPSLGAIGAGLFTDLAGTDKVVGLWGPYDTDHRFIKRFYPTSGGNTILFKGSTEYYLKFWHTSAVAEFTTTLSNSQAEGPSAGWSIADGLHFVETKYTPDGIVDKERAESTQSLRLQVSAHEYRRMMSPGVVTTLRVGATGDNSAWLDWDRPAESVTQGADGSITHYEYRFKEGSGSYGDWRIVPCNVWSGSVGRLYDLPESCGISGLTAGTAHTFQVRAANWRLAGAARYNGQSPEVTITTTGTAPKSDEEEEENTKESGGSKSEPEPEPLTGRFTSSPGEHNGVDFTATFRLSENPAGMSYKTVRDLLFVVSDGDIIKAKREKQRHNQGWVITFRPASASVAVRVTGYQSLPACGDEGAICSEDGQKLSGSVSLRVAAQQ